MYPINSRLYTMFFLKLFKGCFFSPSQRQLTLVKNLGRHFRASVVENHQGPVAHWDVGNPAAPVSPKGDDQRRAFLTFTEVWGPGEFEGGLFFWGNFVFLMLFMRVCWWALSFFCWCLQCSLSFVGVGVVRGAVGSVVGGVVSGCFVIVEFFLSCSLHVYFGDRHCGIFEQLRWGKEKWWFWMHDIPTISFLDVDVPVLQCHHSRPVQAKRLSRALAKLSRPEAVKHFCPEVQ